MKRIVFLALLVLPLAAACSTAPVPLEPYVGGRVVEHAQPAKTEWTDVFSARADKGDVSYVYEWPGVWFEARFTGDSVDVKVDDDQNNLWLWLDGVHKLTLTRPGRTTIALKDLGPGEHVVRIEKASETQTSTGTFGGFFVGSQDRALPPPKYDRRIEFIGDSFTVGYGNTARGQTCTTDDVAATTDTSLSFAPMTAKHFNAAYRINAFSGRGIVRNYADLDHGVTLPVLYRYALFDKSAEAADAGWTPDVVVIGLGTNDFSTALAPGEAWKTREALRADFVATYAAFVKTIRAKWPGVPVVLMASTLYEREIANAVEAVQASLAADGVADVQVIAFSGLDYQACHGHPSLKDEAVLSQLLIERLSSLTKFK